MRFLRCLSRKKAPTTEPIRTANTPADMPATMPGLMPPLSSLAIALGEVVIFVGRLTGELLLKVMTREGRLDVVVVVIVVVVVVGMGFTEEVGIKVVGMGGFEVVGSFEVVGTMGVRGVVVVGRGGIVAILAGR